MNSGLFVCSLAFIYTSRSCVESNDKHILTLLCLFNLGNFVQIDQQAEKTASFSLLAEKKKDAASEKTMASLNVILTSTWQDNSYIRNFKGKQRKGSPF